jgi:UDP-GlcNAc3NAcA epimerase
VWRNVTLNFAWKSLQGEALPVENGGVATLDFVFVDDMVDGLIACTLRGRPGESYNLASGVEIAILDLALGCQRAYRQPDTDRLRTGPANGIVPANVSRGIGFRSGDVNTRRAAAHDCMDPTQSRDDPPLHAAARPFPAAAARRGRMTELRVLTVVGARPQFIKAAPLSRAIAACDGISQILVHTGQHFDPGMSQIFFEELGLDAPRVNLGIHGGGHGEMTGRMLAALERIIVEDKPDIVLVPGDTTSALAGALAAAKLRVPVAHLEAGPRSYNRRMPEEINRVLTDHLSSLLLCPTETAVYNLRREGIVDGVHNIGDVMYDATLFASAASRHSQILVRLGIAGRTYAVATIHRAENTEDRETLGEIIAFLRQQARNYTVVFPVHVRTRKQILAWEFDLGDIMICDPVGYLEMHRLLQSAVAIFTDSGGLQKEAYFHRVPCVTLRGETEWNETIETGWNRLWKGPDYAERRETTAFGDGHAAEKAVRLVLDYF